MNLRRVAADVGKVAARILDEFLLLGNPDCLFAALAEVVEDHAGNLAALADPGAVAQEEPAARLAVGERLTERLAGIDHRLELRVGEQALGDDLLGQIRRVVRVRRRYRGERRRFDERRVVCDRPLDADLLGTVLLEDRIADAAGFGVLARGEVYATALTIDPAICCIATTRRYGVVSLLISLGRSVSGSSTPRRSLTTPSTRPSATRAHMISRAFSIGVGSRLKRVASSFAHRRS